MRLRTPPFNLILSYRFHNNLERQNVWKVRNFFLYNYQKYALYETKEF
jgi:hypothetical protein